MGRNLGRSSCCGNVVKLKDLRGKPIEFRRFKQDAPRIGTKWSCPTCKRSYFVIWSDPIQYASSNTKFNLDLSHYSSFSDEERYDIDQMAEDVYMKREFVEIGPGIVVDKNYNQIVETWQQHNPSRLLPTKESDPSHLCVDDAEDVQDII